MKSLPTVAACSDRTHLRATRAFLPNRIAAVFVVSLGLGSACLIAPYVSAAPPPVTVAQPVEVKVVNPVEVQGVVEVLNDALKVPYFLELVSVIPEGNVVPLTGEPRFVPEGKRFVVESITVYAETPAGQYPNVWLFLPTVDNAPSDAQFGRVDLFLQHQGSFLFYGGKNFSVWKSTHSLKLVVDSNRNSIGVFFARSATADQSQLNVNLVGYLEDL